MKEIIIWIDSDDDGHRDEKTGMDQKFYTCFDNEMTRLDNWIVWKSSLFSSSYSCDVLSRLVTVMNINEKC